jgi:hypothetical protein
MTELTPQHDGVDLRMPDPEAAAQAVIQRLIDAGFVIKEWEPS